MEILGCKNKMRKHSIYKFLINVFQIFKYTNPSDLIGLHVLYTLYTHAYVHVLSRKVMSDFLWPPGSSVHRIFQARILEWVAISSSRKMYRIIPWIQLFKEHLEPKTCWHMGKKCLGIKLKLLPWPYSNQWRIHIWKNLLDLPQEIMELKKVWRMINLRGKTGYLPHMERLKARSDCKGERWSKCDQSL